MDTSTSLIPLGDDLLLPHCQAPNCPAHATKVVWDTYMTPGDNDTLEATQVATFLCALHFALLHQSFAHSYGRLTPDEQRLMADNARTADADPL